MPAQTLVLLLALVIGCAPPDRVETSPNGEVRDTLALSPEVTSTGMVVSGHPEASRVGMEVLASGGNAVDAAVATAFALAVTLPYAGNLGGGGFIVVHFPDGSATAIDFREVAPLAATRDMYLDEEGRADRRRSTVGHLASGVPATPAGLLFALERYGSMDRAPIVEPSVTLAAEGFALTRLQAARFNRYRGAFLEFESTTRYFVKPDTSDFVPEDVFVQADLADVLRRIQDQGHDGFYRGETADLIVAEMERGGGLISHDDLAAYQAVEREVLRGTYRGHEILTMPPPSSGGVTLLQVLNAMEGVEPVGHQSPASVHRAAEAMRRSFADRAVWMGDPDAYEIPVAGLTSKGYSWSRMTTFDPSAVTSSATVMAGVPSGEELPEFYYQPVEEGTETTHLSVVDADGMAVSLTTTVNDWYGSKVVVDGAGFFLNNEMDDFTAAPGTPNFWGSVTGVRNAIVPGRRMLSSMTPTIVLDRHRRPVLVLGTPGGTTIPTTVYQIISQVLDNGLSLQAAVEAPRFHHQWDPDVLYHEAGFPSTTLDSLEAKGWSLRRRGGTSGAVSAIQVDYHEDGTRSLTGARDPRRDITPVGY